MTTIECAETTTVGHRHRFPTAVFLAVISLAVILPVRELAHDVTTGKPTRLAFDEDAYYSFTVARNLAHGHGLTVDGIHATSGFQPLWTIGLAPLFLLPDGVALPGVALVAVALWLLAAWLASVLIAKLTWTGRLSKRGVQLIAAALFLIDPQIRDLFFNGLETGLSIVLFLALVSWILGLRHRRVDTRSAAICGVLLGLLILARFDALLLAPPLLFAAAALVPERSRARFATCAAATAACLVVPWLLYDWWVAGSPVPQSGLALRVGASLYEPSFQQRLDAAVHAVAQLVVWPVAPAAIVGADPMYTLLAAAVVIGLACVALRRANLLPTGREATALGVALGAIFLTTAAFVVTSSATYFYPRYFIILRVLVYVLVCLVVVAVADRVPTQPASSVFLVCLPLLLLGYTMYKSTSVTPYMQREAVALQPHGGLASCGPVGMFESGRTGFAFPGMVVNLDGVVNDAARRAIANGRLLEFLQSQHIDVMYVRAPTVDVLDIAAPEWRRQFVLVPDPRSAGDLFLVRVGADCPSAS